MKAFIVFFASALVCLAGAASTANAQNAAFPAAEPLVCQDGDTMKTCQVVKLDPTTFVVEGAGDLRVSIVEDTRCPRFARCREPGRIILKFTLTETSGVEALPVEVEYKRNQNIPFFIELSDGSVLNADLLAVTHKVSGLPPELFEVKIGYTVDSM